jgi:hypothetical protein
MRGTIAFLVLQALSAGAVGPADSPEVGAGQNASGVILAEEYPFPRECGSAQVWSSMTCTRDDQVVVGLCRSNEPAYLLQFDDRSRRFVAAVRVDSAIDDSRWRVKQAKVHSQLSELPDGWVYGGTHCSEHGQEDSYEGGHWFRYSPKSHKMEDLGLAMPHEGLITMQADPANNCLYSITYPGAYLLRFDLGRRKTQVLGKTSIDKYVDRYFQVLSNGFVCANQVKSGRGRMGGIFLFDVEAEQETVLYPVVFRRSQNGSYSRDDKPGAEQVYNMWIAGTRNSTGSVGYVASQTSGHLISVHVVGKDGLAIYDRGDMMACVQGLGKGTQGGPAGSQTCSDFSGGFLCHAMSIDPKGNVYLTVTVGGDVDTISGSERTHLLRYEPASDGFHDCGIIQTADKADVSSSTAMSITSSGAVYLAASAGSRHETRLMRLDLAPACSAGDRVPTRASASRVAGER